VQVAAQPVQWPALAARRAMKNGDGLRPEANEETGKKASRHRFLTFPSYSGDRWSSAIALSAERADNVLELK
jgi:hypothetical protein